MDDEKDGTAPAEVNVQRMMAQDKDRFDRIRRPVRNALRDLVNDCAPEADNFRCIVCGAHHVEDDGDSSCSVSKAMRILKALG